MIFGRYNYLPCLKTTDAELKGLRHIAGPALAATLPVLELTKSRVTSLNPIGSIHRRLDQLEEILGRREFILDLTVHDDLMNIEIEDLFDEAEGYGRWCGFVSSIEWANIIPAIQVVSGGDPANIRRQVSRLSAEFGRLAFRYDVISTDLRSFLIPICDALEDAGQLVVILDAGFIRTQQEDEEIPNFLRSIKSVFEVCKPEAIVPMSSSFPKSVAEAGYGGDEEGSFALAEVQLSEKLIERTGSPIIFHGDYGSVHPIRYAGGGGWIPRVDVPLDEECFYHRYRREDGGYIRAASEVLDDEFYSSIDAWGDDEILAAAEGAPNGRSPAHWIAVRVNLHMTRQHIRLSDHN